MNDRMIKLFYKSQCVRARIVHASHRATVHYRIPDENNVITVGERSYKIDDASFFFEKGIPTYFFFEENPAPVNIKSPDAEMLPASVFHVAYNNHAAKEVSETTSAKKDVNVLTLIMLFVVIVAIGAVGYLGYKEITNLHTQLDTLEQLLRTVGGF